MKPGKADIRLGDHFTLGEMTHSQSAVRAGLVNTPNLDETRCLLDLVEHILDPLREYLGTPIVVSSGFRSKQVNALVSGATSSQHCLGQAADISVPTLSVAKLAQTIRDLRLPFDQLIDEFGSWVHVSYSARHRRQALVARMIGGKTSYLPMDG